ncbi:CBS domain-containing protein [Acaryochloris sp. CCMEE 5410]|uniref:CBS domain-containing protein n=1 Tax=Acaryochloris sp. CCMEE 5410 TaxID=310037 RepID=UPI0002484373|nr:CBS domain-containing protein [Acaryochloris sp. CCMEE 5410]KAI9132143.1 CBS domain-containing protein [Acaryochloris sp. CCMEE 5410]
MGSRWPVTWQPVSTSIINPQPLTVTVDTPVMSVLKQMSQLYGAACAFPIDPKESLLQASCAIVTHSSGRLAGVFTERDLVQLMVEGQDLAHAYIGDVLRDLPVTISPEQCQDISAPLFLMRRAKVQHLPVVTSQQKVLGIVTLDSLCQAIEATNFLQLWSVQAVMSTEVVCAAPSMSILYQIRFI